MRSWPDLPPMSSRPLTPEALEGYSAVPTLVLEFHGSAAAVAEQAASAEEIASSFGASGFQWATDTAERNRLW